MRSILHGLLLVASLVGPGCIPVVGTPVQRFYSNGVLESRGPYANGLKTGLHETWWPNGQRRSAAHYERDAYHGEYRTWLANGRPYELRQFAHGRESGRQQSWNEDGSLFLNYDVRNGRRYGLVNAAPCEPADSVVAAGRLKAEVTGPRPTAPHRVAFRLVRTSTAASRGDGSGLPFYSTRDLAPLWTGTGHAVGAFSLVDQTGAPFTHATVSGRVHIASFVYTRCSAICPMLVRSLKRVQARLTDPAVLLVSYSVTPELDPPPVLASFGRASGVDPARWKLVTGDKTQIYALARDSYFADDDRLRAQSADEGFLHTEKLVLVDSAGRVRGVYNGTQPFDIDHLIADANALASR